MKKCFPFTVADVQKMESVTRWQTAEIKQAPDPPHPQIRNLFQLQKRKAPVAK